jgi:hypothetical protein
MRILGLSLREAWEPGLAYLAMPGLATKFVDPVAVPEKPRLSLATWSSLHPTAVTPIRVDFEDDRPQEPDADEDEALRREAELITPSNERLRAMIGRFTPAPGTFDDEEMPF